ncbi:MAG: Ig-like domain-containing protein, partial [Thermoplasmatales archaeon]|nr:Ig-like domain-containing protein [Thermoplasmatales archaeon]
MQNSKMLHSRKKKMLIAVGFGVLLIFAGFLSSSNNVVGSGPKATTHTVVNVNMATFEGKIMPADDATEANDGWVRIYFYPRSNELGDIVNYENPQTTQPSFLVDKIGTSGNTGISRGSTCDCQGFPTEWALGEDLVCVIDKNTASGGYTGSSDMIIDSNDPQEFPYSKLYKIPSVTFTGSSIDWSLPSGWDANGNVYGFRIYEATAEAGPYSVIGNVTGNTTTTFSYSPTIGYWYKISVLYRGQQGGVEDYTTVIESLYTGAPAQYTLPLTVTVNAPDGGEIWMGSSTHDISYTISGGTPNYNVWLNYSTSGLAGPWNPCSGPAQPVTQTGSGTSTYAWTLPSADSTNCYARVEVVDSSSNSASDNSNTAFTIDSTSPYISLTTPADSAAGVALNQNVAVQFSEKMNITTVTYECTPDPLGWSPSWNSPTNTILTLTHNNFNPSTTYEFNVTAGKDVAGNDLAPGVGTTTYSFTGVTTAGPHDAYACDVDVFPFAGDAANRNTMVEATDAQYTAISSSDNSRWTTIDPGNGDQIFMWFEINSITESPAAIVQIDFTFEGYSALASDMKIYVMKAGADWTLSASWVQVGGTMSFAAGVDSTMMVSLTSGFSTYIDGTGKLVWGVYQVVSSEALNVDYVCVKITSTTSAPNPWTFTTVTDNPPTSSASVAAPYWKTSAPFNVGWSASDDNGLTAVALYYRYSTDNATWGGWTLFARNESVSGLSASGTFSFTAPSGNGYYEFYTLANDTMPQTEAAPASADAVAGLDSVAPSSSVNAISPYWQTASPLTITATASDTVSGLASVELWHRYSTDNSTWGGWSLFGTDTASPWSWSFNFPNGTGYYQFYSRAKDNATNYEAAPGSADAICGYDNTVPTSSVNVISPYWQTTSPITITATASDTVSGLASVELWYRYSTDNVTWGGWSLFGTDTVAPWSWSFGFPNGTSYYEFYSRAKDNATNYESAPGVRDALCGFDNAAPTSSVNIVSPYWQTVSPLTVSASASDGVSGLASVELWYRYSADNVTFGGWVLFGTDTASPWQWSFNFPNGTGYYQFYSRARDNATNYEAAPGSADAICGYDNAVPTSNVNTISPYWQTTSPLTITGTASDTGYSGLASVELWYRYSADNVTFGGWVLFGTDSVSPWSWSFTFPNGTGYYQFYSRARDNATNYEAAPGSRDALCGYDNSAPTSSVDVISPYWQNTSPITITATASDTVSGLASVELWYRYSADNTTFGGWVLFGTDTASPWSWSFTFSNGTGYYEFYTRARDNATNYESAPGSADALCGYDNAVPTSNVNVISPYWQTASPLTITGTASDTGYSGLASVELWHRYSTDNSTWGGWVLFGTDTASPWQWSFNFPNGTGYYEFYSRAKDNATNYESAPGVRDALCGFDNAAPTSSVNVISPYWQIITPFTVSASASDGVSGLASVELWYRYSADNVTFGGWTSFGTDTVSPWSWSFSFPNGTGYYEFYSRAKDNATNYESAPGVRDALCGFDNAAPTSSVNVISPYWQNTSPITITATASDTVSGLASVELWHRYSTDNSTWGGWVLFGTDSVSPWSWSFSFPNGTGYYEFYSRARDTATNYEAAPASRDALCSYDNAAPTSSVNIVSPYWQIVSPLTVTATASDAVSGLASVELWHRYSTDNVTWGGWVLSGTDTVAPWSWSFAFSNGTGYYEFYTRARDTATNYESAPGSRDALCGYDNVA